ncbi:MAG TPA: molybdopterin cofactor-binding domain-containing protein, partial [Gemmatimonadaceae bacterium]|nr:molybdopterin cofactor-binding domain-containing protein [Gemmatimonadaceae bacterium]
MKNEPVTRRSFVTLSAVAGAAFVLGFRADDARGATPGAIGLVDPETGRVRDADWTPNLYLSIDAQGVVRIMSHKSEMGQGVWTALPMIVAEELDADWSKVRVERAPTNGKYQTSTGGSTSVRTSWTPLRNAGATARAMLVAAAARQWGVPASECRTEAGVVSHASGKRATYGELAAAAAQVPVPAASEVRLKSPADYRIIGKATPRLDLPAKVNGEMKFGIDTRVPGMLYASVARCPVIGGSIRSV